MAQVDRQDHHQQRGERPQCTASASLSGQAQAQRHEDASRCQLQQDVAADRAAAGRACPGEARAPAAPGWTPSSARPQPWTGADRAAEQSAALWQRPGDERHQRAGAQAKPPASRAASRSRSRVAPRAVPVRGQIRTALVNAGSSRAVWPAIRSYSGYASRSVRSSITIR